VLEVYKECVFQTLPVQDTILQDKYNTCCAVERCEDVSDDGTPRKKGTLEINDEVNEACLGFSEDCKQADGCCCVKG